MSEEFENIKFNLFKGNARLIAFIIFTSLFCVGSLFMATYFLDVKTEFSKNQVYLFSLIIAVPIDALLIYFGIQWVIPSVRMSFSPSGISRIQRHYSKSMFFNWGDVNYVKFKYEIVKSAKYFVFEFEVYSEKYKNQKKVFSGSIKEVEEIKNIVNMFSENLKKVNIEMSITLVNEMNKEIEFNPD